MRSRNLVFTLFAAVALSAAPSALARDMSFRVIGAGGQVLFDQLIEFRPGSLGEVTHQSLTQAAALQQITSYQGSDAGPNQINGLGSALEVRSDTAMNAYGWCYRVDGEVSLLLAQQYALTGQESEIEWFYGYARFERTEWTAMCVPADHEPVQE